MTESATLIDVEVQEHEELAVEDEMLVEEVSIDGLCGVY